MFSDERKSSLLNVEYSVGLTQKLVKLYDSLTRKKNLEKVSTKAINFYNRLFNLASKFHLQLSVIIYTFLFIFTVIQNEIIVSHRFTAESILFNLACLYLLNLPRDTIKIHVAGGT